LNRLQIFKPGKHTAADGRVLEFTPAQLEACAKAYDPALHEAPIVVGHPKSDLPAYGWAKSLAFADGVLGVEPHQVDAAFAELVNAGRFKKISASFYLPEAPENPKPGSLYLRHIGFLGAQAPAVRGLKSASFSASSEGVVEFMDWSKSDIASVLRGIRDFFIEQFGLDKADKAIPSFYVDSIRADAVRAAAQDTAPAGIDVTSYSERTHVKTKEQEELERREREVKEREEKLARERAEFSERERTLNAEKVAASRAAVLAGSKTFVEGLVKAGKVLPAHAEGLAAFMAALPSEGVVEFGEGDKAQKKPSLEWLRAYLQAQPKVVDFAERGAGHDAGGGSSDPLEQAAQISRKAAEFMESEAKAGRQVNIAHAVAHVKATQAS
jgi:hypothetical protein